MEQWTSKVAADWDNMEKKLHNPFFWSMLNAVEDAINPSHISFLLSFAAKDIYAEDYFKKTFASLLTQTASPKNLAEQYAVNKAS